MIAPLVTVTEAWNLVPVPVVPVTVWVPLVPPEPPAATVAESTFRSVTLTTAPLLMVAVSLIA